MLPSFNKVFSKNIPPPPSSNLSRFPSPAIAPDKYYNPGIPIEMNQTCTQEGNNFLATNSKSRINYQPLPIPIDPRTTSFKISSSIKRTIRNDCFTSSNSSRAHYQQEIPSDSKYPSLERSKSVIVNRNHVQFSNSINNLKEKKTKGETRKKVGCIVYGCTKKAKLHHRCVAHGGVRICVVDGCNKHVVTGGVCINHGGGKRCSIKLCTRAARKDGLCWSHGGKQYCTVEGCRRGPKSGTGGLCSHHCLS